MICDVIYVDNGRFVLMSCRTMQPHGTAGHQYLEGQDWSAEAWPEWKQRMHVKTPVNSPCEQPISGSAALLRSGIYMLIRYDRVVFIGRSKCLLATIAAHRAACSGPRLPEWFPIKRIQFDDFQYIPCAMDRANLLLPALIELHQPSHNIYNKPTLPMPTFQLPRAAEGAAPRITRRI